MTFQITESEISGNPVLVLSGRVQGEGDQHLRDRLESMSKRQADKIFIDVSQADYIDSHGLGIIVYYHKVMHNQKRVLVMVNANPDPDSYMGRLIEITNIDKVIPYVKSVEAA